MKLIHLGKTCLIDQLRIAVSMFVFLGLCRSTFAQTPQQEGDFSDQDVEALYDKDDAGASKAKEAKSEKKSESEVEKKDVQSLSDLATLAPFSDVAIIQRRYLPKTSRFELTGGAFTNLNNPFFNALGINARLAYYLRERYALEAILALATTSSRQVTDDLANEPGISTDNVVTSRGFGALAFKWNPIYGKMTWLNKTIVPFDLNFNLGLGLTRTTEDRDEPTLHLGTSQVFALSKGMAFRWDLIWNFYQAKLTRNDQSTETLNQNDLYLGVGMSFYFPEASYR